MSIQPLPKQVIAQIKSSITITSLNGVIGELLRNSLDAGSTKVDLNVDYVRGSCVIEDNGFGIVPQEFHVNGGLGKMYHTSKWNSQAPVHGGRGVFLAALSAMALVTVTSHHHLHRSHNTLSLHRSEIVSRQAPSLPQQHLAAFNHGTRVTVHDLFGNMPVRVKQRAITMERQKGTAKELEELKHEIVKLLLSWPGDVAVGVRESSANQKIIIRAPSVPAQPGVTLIPRICSILSQATYIDLEEKASWISVGVSTGRLKLSGAISLEPSATKAVQFLSFGIEPISRVNGHGVLHDEINRLFMNSTFGNMEDIVDLNDSEQDRRAKDKRFKSDGYTKKELKATRKGVDRWPKFFINIELERVDNTSGNGLSVNVDNVLNGKGKDLNTIIELLQIMTREFLEKYQFQPKTMPHGRSKADSRNNTQLLLISSRKSPDKATRSASRSCPVTKSSLKRNQTSFDPLGTNIKLPSFRQAALKADTPFNVWTRMKIGNQNSSQAKKHSLALAMDNISQIQRPLTAPPSTAVRCEREIIARSTTPDLVKPSKNPISRNGKIVRPPFDGVDDPKPRSPFPKNSTEAKHMTPTNDRFNSNEFITWVNPVTKLKSVVDARTGLTIPASRTSSSTSTRTTGHDARQSISIKPLASNGSCNPSPWISEILKTWDNPVFALTEKSIPIASFNGFDVSTHGILGGHWHHCPRLDIDKAFNESAAGINGQISKESLKKSEVIAQVDKKFILLKLLASRRGVRPHRDPNFGEMLVILDQHAADERIRIEILLEELCLPTADSNSTGSFIKTDALDKHLVFEIPLKDLRLLTTYKQHFSNWGILYDISTSPSGPTGPAQQQILVWSLPPVILERCKLDPQLLIDFIRSEVWKVHEMGAIPSPKPGTWLQQIQNCPQGLIDMLNSRACRSAIMFNDELTMEQCQTLVRRLADCKFPFQCAHGRPSLVPLLELEPSVESVGETDDSIRFSSVFQKWKKDQ